MLAYANVLGYLGMYMLGCAELATITKKLKKLNVRLAQRPNYPKSHLRIRQS